VPFLWTHRVPLLIKCLLLFRPLRQSKKGQTADKLIQLCLVSVPWVIISTVKELKVFYYPGVGATQTDRYSETIEIPHLKEGQQPFLLNSADQIE
jgi:hypothetical protein